MLRDPKHPMTPGYMTEDLFWIVLVLMVKQTKGQVAATGGKNAYKGLGGVGRVI